MQSREFVGLVAVLVIFMAGIAGCAMTPNTGNGPAVPVATTAAGTQPGPVSSGVQGTPVSTTAVQSSGIDVMINIHYNDYDCLDVTKESGVVYLNPGQKYTIRVSPASSPVNVNVLLLDVGDREKIQTVKPEWNTITKSWNYAGLVPLVQFNDVSTTQEKTVTIKNQGKYYLCADDRKESGVNDAIIRVPVKMTKA
jgi:hypothetical protein